MMSPEVFSQRVQQFRMSALRIQIECERRIYNAYAHKLGPYQVYSSPGKLDVAGQHSSVGYPRVFSGFGFFSREQEGGRYIRPVALHPGYAFPREIVTLTVVGQGEIAVIPEVAPQPRRG